MITEIFEEFMSLCGWKRVKLHPTEDILAGSEEKLIIVRIREDRVIIHSLFCGNDIVIPGNMMCLFEALAVHSGDRILYENKIKKGDKVSKLIYYFIKLVTYLSARRMAEFIETIDSIISDIGTEDFRKWYKDRFGSSLEPITVKTINGVKEL